MKVLYATMSVVEDDGYNFYSNPIQATYKRYLSKGDEITVLCYKKSVKKAKSDLIDTNIINYVFVEKISSIIDIFKRVNSRNERIIEETVKKVDVCFIHLPCSHGYKVIKYAKLYGKPYMNVICACTWDEYWNYDWRGKIIAPYEFFKLRKAQKEAKYSIYVTNEFLQHRYPTKGKSIGCSNVNIHTGVENVLDKRLKNIRERNKNKGVLKIGTAAAVDVPYKGQKYVIEALSILKGKGISYEYHLIGKGDNSILKEIAEKKGVSDQVYFHGAIPHQEVLDYLDSIDIYIQPSKQEGLPRALIEAMSRGCMCLGSKTAGIPELLQPEFIFPKGDVKEIVKQLLDITEEVQIAQAKRNYETAKEYDVNLLNEKRNIFIELFKNKIK